MTEQQTFLGHTRLACALGSVASTPIEALSCYIGDQINTPNLAGYSTGVRGVVILEYDNNNVELSTTLTVNKQSTRITQNW